MVEATSTTKTTNNKKPAYYAGFWLFRICLVEARGIEPLYYVYNLITRKGVFNAI